MLESQQRGASAGTIACPVSSQRSQITASGHWSLVISHWSLVIGQQWGASAGTIARSDWMRSPSRMVKPVNCPYIRGS